MLGSDQKSVLVVAANPDSTSAKARRARDLGVPIIGERMFAQLLSAMMEAEMSTEPDMDAVGVYGTEPKMIALFPWLRDVEFEEAEEFDTLRAAELWIEHHPTRALHSLSHVFAGHGMLTVRTKVECWNCEWTPLRNGDGWSYSSTRWMRVCWPAGRQRNGKAAPKKRC